MQKIILFFGLILLANKSMACDVCGCAASSFSLGLLPSSNHHFIGIRSNIRTFQTTHPPLFGFQEPSTDEVFTSTDLMGRWKINHRFQLMAVVPYVYNSQKTTETTIANQGLGDITLLGNYVFIQNTDSLTRKFKQAGTFGIGAKLPTGKFDNTNVNNRNMLPGTGTIDFIASLNYSIQKGSWGYLTESSFSYKTENKYDYQFGHALGTTHLAFYRWVLNENLRILPQVGLNYNHNFRDRIKGKVTDDSYNGGTILNAQFTVAAIFKNWMFSANYFAPVYQDLGNGYVVQKTALRFGINYFITKK
jgi:hypothetical protein